MNKLEKTENLQSGLPHFCLLYWVRLDVIILTEIHFCQDLRYYTVAGSCIIVKDTLAVQR